MILHGRLLLDPIKPPPLGWVRVEEHRIGELGEGPPPCDAGPTLGGADRIISPGFIDAHLHLPQVRGIGCDAASLLEWLERVIFPLESSWDDARVVAADVRRANARMLASGTLGCAAFSSPHASAMPTVMLGMRGAGPASIRMIVGQSLMDREAPSALVESPPWVPDAALDSDRVVASVNPRFAVSCSDALHAQVATLAERANADTTSRIIHTHLAESRGECDRVRDLFPEDDSYTAVYDRHRLLGPRTLLAHAVHLSPAEWRTIAARGSVVVRCPQANAFLRSGLFDAKAARDHAVRIALGSDIAAGSDFAMPRVARTMIECDKLRAAAIDATTPVATPAEAWRLITEGNADALGWRDAGRIAVGASADLLVLRPDFEIDGHLIGRLIHGWDDRWIEHVVLRGERIR